MIFLSVLGMDPQLVHSQVVNSTQNPEQIAVLHWYPANLTTTFTVGTEPDGMAFDGVDLWVANAGSDTVTRLQASTGTGLRAFAFAPGTRPGWRGL